MKRKMIVLSSVVASLMGIRKQLELVSYNCDDKRITDMCDDIRFVCDKITNRADKLFKGVEPIQEEPEADIPTPVTHEQQIVEAEAAVNDAQKLFVDAKTDEQLEAAEEAIAKAEDTLENLRLKGDFDFFVPK